MKRIILFVLLFVSFSHATTSVTGKIQTLGTGNITSGAFARFWLRGCAGNQPRVNGTSVIGPSQGGVFFFDISSDSGGNVSGTIYSTRDSTGVLAGDIECGGSKLAVWYGLQIFVSGKGGPEIPVHAKSGGALDITSVTPITTNPVVISPTGDTTYARLDGGNMPFLAPVSANGGFLGAVANGGSITINGLSRSGFSGGGISITGGDCLSICGGQTGGSIVLTPGSPTATNADVVLNRGIAPDTGSGFKHKRVIGCTTGATSGNTCTTTVTWTTTFADANYTPVCMLLGPATLGHLAAISTDVIAAASVKVETVTDTNAAVTGTINCIAVHD